MKISAGTKKLLIILASLIVVVALFVVLRPQGIVKLPINQSDGPSTDMSGMTNVKSFSDANKNKTPKSNITNATTAKTVKPKKTPKPLPYPRISVNYSIKKTRSIGSNNLDKNSTFVIVMLDIRNYGYVYFDAHQSKFRMGTTGDIRPIVNISTGKPIDAVLPNNSRAKGSVIFILGKGVNQGTIKFFSTNKSESYNILYKKLSQSEMEGLQQGGISDEDWK